MLLVDHDHLSCHSAPASLDSVSHPAIGGVEADVLPYLNHSATSILASHTGHRFQKGDPTVLHSEHSHQLFFPLLCVIHLPVFGISTPLAIR